MAKGSLPRYVVNLEEFVESLNLGGHGQLPFNKELQRSKGIHIHTSGKQTTPEVWIPKFDMAITGLKIGCNEEAYMDSFDLIIEHGQDTNELFKSIYMKDIYDYKNFKCFTPVKADSKVTIVYNNANGTEKDIWFDIDYICEEQTSHIALICMDIETDTQLKYENIGSYSIGEHIVYAPQIPEYTPVPTYFQRIVVDRKNVEDKYKGVQFDYVKTK